jgi:hypothetical protein
VFGKKKEADNISLHRKENPKTSQEKTYLLRLRGFGVQGSGKKQLPGTFDNPKRIG